MITCAVSMFAVNDAYLIAGLTPPLQPATSARHTHQGRPLALLGFGHGRGLSKPKGRKGWSVSICMTSTRHQQQDPEPGQAKLWLSFQKQSKRSTRFSFCCNHAICILFVKIAVYVLFN